MSSLSSFFFSLRDLRYLQECISIALYFHSIPAEHGVKSGNFSCFISRWPALGVWAHGIWFSHCWGGSFFLFFFLPLSLSPTSPLIVYGLHRYWYAKRYRWLTIYTSPAMQMQMGKKDSSLERELYTSINWKTKLSGNTRSNIGGYDDDGGEKNIRSMKLPTGARRSLFFFLFFCCSSPVARYEYDTK